MSKLDELINLYCPDGVRFCNITEIADTYIGLVTTMTKHYADDGVLLLHNSDIKENKIVLKEVVYLDIPFAEENSTRKHKLFDIITVHTGDIGTSAVIEKEHVGSLGFATIVTRIKDFDSVNPYFLCYYLNSYLAKNQIYSMVKGDRNNLNLKDFNKIIVPVPPMEIQREIIRVLDTFRKLKTELLTELIARKKQYGYYLESLLTNKNTRLVELNELILKIDNIKWNLVNENNVYQYIDLSSVSRENGSIGDTTAISTNDHPSRAQQIIKTNDILFGTTRPLLKRQTIVEEKYDGQICSTGFCVLRPNITKVLPEWILFNIQTSSFYSHVELNLVPGNYPSIPDSAVKKFKIPLPSLDEQRRIIKLLSNFNIYCNGVSQGLPAEIEARKRQYEFYKNKLLSFKENDTL